MDKKSNYYLRTNTRKNQFGTTKKLYRDHGPTVHCTQSLGVPGLLGLLFNLKTLPECTEHHYSNLSQSKTHKLNNLDLKDSL